MILYNVPSRREYYCPKNLFRAFKAQKTNCDAKEANGNIGEIFITRHLCGDEFHLYSGNDDQIVPKLSLGELRNFCFVKVVPKRPMIFASVYFEGKVEQSANASA
jgi:4-hydroxy-tetrahydrodipicolinate synthase